MNHVIDTTLVAVLVVMSTLFAAYSLSPLSVKKRVLSKVSRYFGIKVMTWMLPKNCGCEDCPSASRSVHQKQH